MVNHVFLRIPAVLHMTNANKIAVQTTTLSEEFLIIQRLNFIASRNLPVDHQITFNKSIFNIYETQPQVLFIHLNKGERGILYYFSGKLNVCCTSKLVISQ